MLAMTRIMKILAMIIQIKTIEKLILAIVKIRVMRMRVVPATIKMQVVRMRLILGTVKMQVM